MSIWRVVVRSGPVCALVALGGCGVFFPEQGDPVEAGRYRSSALGAVQQLVAAYENKSIGLFEDLFSRDKTFRFYVAPSLEREFGGIVRAEEIDTQCMTVPPRTYYYWDYDREVGLHRRMFGRVRQIDFTVPPVLLESYVTYRVQLSIDTLSVDSVGDSLTYAIQRAYDTTAAEVWMRAGEIDFTMEDGTVEGVGIGDQIFCLRRDPADRSLWVIDKWFDLGN